MDFLDSYLPPAARGTQSITDGVMSKARSGRRQSALQSLGLKKKAEAEVILDGDDNFVHSYSTFDQIKGHVALRFDKDTCIEDFHIYLQGQTTTWVEMVTTVSPRVGRATGKHVFLRMNHLVDTNIFGDGNVAKAGVTYSVPFTFVVPDRLLPFICSHGVEHEGIREHHRRLPPSTGDAMVAGEGQVLMDDLAPSMSKIAYAVCTRVVKANPTNRHPDIILESMPVRIVPISEEMPPVPIKTGPDACKQYRLRKEKDVRRGVFGIGKKQGRLVAETRQPRSLQLLRSSPDSNEATTTMATIDLRFDPVSREDQPPQLDHIDTKLKSWTFFGAACFRSIPGPNDYDVWSGSHGHYPSTTDLSTMNLRSVDWTKHEPNAEPVPVPVRKASTGTTNTRSSASGRTSHRQGSSAASDAICSSPTYMNPLLRRESNLSEFSEVSASSESSATTPSSPTSPVLSTKHMTIPTISPSTSYKTNLPYYTATILVPVTLPSSSAGSNSHADAAGPSASTRRHSSMPVYTPTSSMAKVNAIGNRKRVVFLPTFHSCLVSRVYSLELDISPAGSTIPSITLRTPLQMHHGTSSHHQRVAAANADANANITTISSNVEWYDPFSQDLEQDYTQPPAEERDMTTRHPFNRSASVPTLSHTNPFHSSRQINPRTSLPDTIPEYSELDPRDAPVRQSFRDTADTLYDLQQGDLDSPEPAIVQSPTQEAPPEYYSSFRQRTSNARSASSQTPSTGGASAEAASQRRSSKTAPRRWSLRS